jgi:hypothetical protein
MLRRTLAWILVAGLTLAGVPLTAAQAPQIPDTVWGEVPSWAGSASNAVLLDSSLNVVASVPVIGGQFAFENVVPGQYWVALNDASGVELARSRAAQMSLGAVVKAIFDESIPPAALATGGGGFGTTAWILTGIGVAGIGAIVYFATNDDDGNASGAR